MTEAEQRQLDLYKERGTSKEFLAEPVNLLSNIAFFAASLIAFLFCKNWVDGLLAAGIAMVGIGSSLYHARPCRLTQLCDVVSIIAWTAFYIFVWAHYMMGFTFLISTAMIGVGLGLNFLFARKFKNSLNGSADYLPVIGLLLICGGGVWYKMGHPHLVAAAVFAASALVFRVIDNDVKVPCGTHFLWHMLNGFMMAMLTMFVSVHVVIPE